MSTKKFDHFISGGVSYDVALNDFRVTPGVTYFGAPVDKLAEGMIAASWRETFNAAVGYRTNNTVAMRVEFQSGSVAVGYAFGVAATTFQEPGFLIIGQYAICSDVTKTKRDLS